MAMTDQELEQLNALSKEDILKKFVELKDEVFKLKSDFMRVTELRLYHLERNQNMYEQYGRRESFEVTGIPVHIGKDNPEELEAEIIAIAKEAKVLVNRQPLKASDICAVHRLKNKKTTIVRVVNRKFAFQCLVNGKNLKDTKRYGAGNNIYINNRYTSL